MIKYKKLNQSQCSQHPQNCIQFFCIKENCKHNRLGCQDCLLFFDSNHFNHQCLEIKDVEEQQKIIIKQYYDKEKQKQEEKQQFYRDFDNRQKQKKLKNIQERTQLKELYNYIESENMLPDELQEYDDEQPLYDKPSNQEKYEIMKNMISSLIKTVKTTLNLTLDNIEKQLQEKLIITLDNPTIILNILKQPIVEVTNLFDQKEIASVLTGDKFLRISKQPTHLQKQNLQKIISDLEKYVSGFKDGLLSKVKGFDFGRSKNDFNKKGFQGKVEVSLDYHKERILSMEYCNINNRLYSVSNDKKLVIYDLDTKQIIEQVIFDEEIKSILLMNPSTYIIGLGNGEINLYENNKLKFKNFYHKSSVYGLYKLNDTEFISTSDQDVTVVLWNTYNFKKQIDYQNHSLAANSLEIIEGGGEKEKFITVSDFDKYIRIFEKNKEKPIFQQKYKNYSFRCISKISYTKFMVGTKSGSLLLFQFTEMFDTFKIIGQFDNCHDDWVTKILPFDRNMSMFASCSCDNLIKFWQFNDNEITNCGKLDKHKHTVYDLIVNNNGQLISCSKDSSILIWK